MKIIFRPATLEDIDVVLELYQDDSLGHAREGAEVEAYRKAFLRMSREGNNHLIVGEWDGRVIATYQLTFITGLSLKAARRAQIESVRVASYLRSRRIGEAMIKDAEARALKAGCDLMQLTMNKARSDTARFYTRLGFTASHIGYKRDLS